MLIIIEAHKLIKVYAVWSTNHEFCKSKTDFASNSIQQPPYPTRSDPIRRTQNLWFFQRLTHHVNACSSNLSFCRVFYVWFQNNPSFALPRLHLFDLFCTPTPRPFFPHSIFDPLFLTRALPWVLCLILLPRAGGSAKFCSLAPTRSGFSLWLLQSQHQSYHNRFWSSKHFLFIYFLSLLYQFLTFSSCLVVNMLVWFVFDVICEWIFRISLILCVLSRYG